MKKTISLLLLAIAFSFGGCKKPGCWKCTTKQANNQAVIFSGAAGKYTECGKTEAEIRTLERDRSGTQIDTTNGINTYFHRNYNL